MGQKECSNMGNSAGLASSFWEPEASSPEPQVCLCRGIEAAEKIPALQPVLTLSLTNWATLGNCVYNPGQQFS